ncbi:MAG: chromosome segregation protein SMC [Myxococcaceae bacterium]|nr:chromosome segregation protein SMC [Myxococcaceae bacterium]
MLILELAVQGVRGFSPSARVAFKPGYTVLKSPTEIPAPLAGLALALVFPDGRGGDGAFLAPGAKSGRAGLSLQSTDQEVWRVVRDLGGQGALHKLNRQTNQFEVLTQDAGEIAQAVRSSGLPARPTFEQLFTFSVGQLPSRRPRASSAQKTTTAMPARSSPSQARVQSAFDQYANELKPADSGPSVEKLAALEKELAIAKEVAELQFHMDGVQADAFKAEHKLRAYDELKGKLEAARAELFKAPTPQSLGLPDDIVERVQRSGDEKKRKDEAIARLEREKAEAGISEHGPRIEPLWKDVRFLGSAALGALLLVAGVVLEGMGRFLALAAIPAFTFAGLLALRFIEELQHASREAAKREVFETRRKKLDDEFGLAASIVQTALDKVEANTPDEFFTIMAKRAELQPAVGQLELEFADYEADPDTAGLADTVARLKQEHEAMNQRLLGLSGGYAREAREIEREIARTKEALAGKTPAAASGDEFSAVPTGPQETFDDPCPAPMQLACEIFSADLPTLWGVIRDRCVQYLMALTDKRYHAVDLDANGRATVHAPGRTIAAGELPAKDLDLLYLALRLTLAEKAGAQTKLPVLLEDAFGGVIDVNKQVLFARMLKHIGTLTQVLHVIGGSQQPPQADAVLAV